MTSSFRARSFHSHRRLVFSWSSPQLAVGHVGPRCQAAKCCKVSASNLIFNPLDLNTCSHLLKASPLFPEYTEQHVGFTVGCGCCTRLCAPRVMSTDEPKKPGGYPPSDQWLLTTKMAPFFHSPGGINLSLQAALRHASLWYEQHVRGGARNPGWEEGIATGQFSHTADEPTKLGVQLIHRASSTNKWLG